MKELNSILCKAEMFRLSQTNPYPIDPSVINYIYAPLSINQIVIFVLYLINEIRDAQSQTKLYFKERCPIINSTLFYESKGNSSFRRRVRRWW